MSQILICSEISWAALHESLPSWLPEDSANTLILTPSQWKTQLPQFRFPNGTALTIVEWLERYIAGQFNQKRLLFKSAMTHLLNAIIYESTGEEKAVAARFLNIETSYPGYVRALTEFIIDFRENGGESLLAALSARKARPLSARERDLIDIHDELESVLQSRNLFDFRGALAAFLQDANSPIIPAPEKSTLLVFGFHHLTALETKLLNGLSERFAQTILAICRNASAAETVFRSQISLENFIAQLKQQNTHEIREVEIARGQTTFPQQLAESIFHDDKSARLLQPQREVQITEANNRSVEVTNLARQIRRLHAEGIPFERMRLIFPSYEIYASLLLEIFPAYEITYRLGPGTPLAFYPPAQLVLNMINHAIMPSPFALRETIFSSPYITYSCEVNSAELGEFANNIEAGLLPDEKVMAALLPEPQTFALDFAQLQKLRRRAAQAVRSGEALHPLRLVARYLQARHHDNPEEQQRAVFNIAVKYFVLARAEKALYVWRSAMVPAEFCQAVEKLLARFNIEENFNAPMPAEIIQQDRQVLAHLRQILASLQEQFETLGGQAAPKFPLVDLVQAFTTMMRDSEYYLPDERADGIFVCTPLEAPLGNWETTFLGGLIDGDFPTQQPFNFLQPKSEGRGLTGDLAPVDRDRQALYQILASTSRHVLISYPISAGNKKLLVSPFVTEMRKCFAAEIPTENETSQRFYTAREKLAFMAQNIDRSVDRAVSMLRDFKHSAPDTFEQIIAILECDGRRASVSSFSQFDGLINSNAALSAIAAQLQEHATLQVDQLERFAGCSLRFLFDDLMHLKPEFITDYHPDTTERGLLMRRILTAYSRAVAASGKIPDHAAAVLHEAASAAASEMLTEKDNLFSRRFKNGLLTGLQNTASDKKRRPGVLAAFLNFEQTAPDLLSPHLADLVFSRNAATALRLKGVPFDIPITIARVDRTYDGKYLLIFNYSSADLGDVEKIGKGLRFDLPLQILALRQNLSDNEQTVAGAGVCLVKSHRDLKRGGYFALKDLQASRRENVSEQTPIFSGQRKYGFLPVANFEQELQNVERRVAHIVDLIRRGRFHLPICSMKDQICPNCHFNRICRIEQLRVDMLYAQADEQETYKPKRKVE